MTLGERLAKLRNQKNLSQDALANTLGVSRQSISKWETDASIPELDKLIRLSELYGISLDELVKGGPPPHTAPPRPGQRPAPWLRAAAWYREKAYLLGWLSVIWGLYGMVRSVLAVVVHYLPIGGLSGALDLFGTMFYLHVENLLKLLLGFLIVHRGEKRGGPFHWYQLGWALFSIGLFGITPLRPFRTGPLSALLSILFLLLPFHGPEALPEYLIALLPELCGCVLLMLSGIFVLHFGKLRAPKVPE